MTTLGVSRPSTAVRAALVVLGVAVLLRVTDVFVLRTDEWLGEQWLTKGVGVVIILLYLRMRGDGPGAIGLHRRRWTLALALGAAITAVALAVGYAVEVWILTALRHTPRFVVAFQDHVIVPDTAATGGLVFGLGLLAGNLLNSFMEEGLFRGLLLTHLVGAMSVRRANLTQATLFGFWHLVWPIRAAMDGAMTVQMAVAASAVYVAASGIVGYAWGMLFLWTGSLWTSWSAHTVHNSVLNLVHVYTPAGKAATLGLRVGVATAVLVLSLPLVERWVVAEGNVGNGPLTRIGGMQ